LKETSFEEVYVQPAAGDGGGALGAALWAYNTLLGKPRDFTMNHAYWGRSYSDGENAQFLKENNISFRHLENEDQLLDEIVARLVAGKVVGWSQGRFEWGPRALGHRSILADPRNPDMKDIVNAKIKFREPYRPFAPSVLAECAEKYFDLPNAAQHCPARYMLYVVPVRKEQHTISQRLRTWMAQVACRRYSASRVYAIIV
jgi:carbamoyltransferase